MIKLKAKFTVYLNWRGESYKIFTTASTLDQAFNNACNRLGKRTKISGKKILQEVKKVLNAREEK